MLWPPSLLEPHAKSGKPGGGRGPGPRAKGAEALPTGPQKYDEIEPGRLASAGTPPQAPNPHFYHLFNSLHTPSTFSTCQESEPRDLPNDLETGWNQAPPLKMFTTSPPLHKESLYL